MSVLQEHVSQNIRQARQRLGLSQQELADRADLSRRMITLIENALGNASLATLDRIAHALNVPFAELIRPPSQTSAHIKPIPIWQGEHPRSRASLLQNAAAHRSVELWEWSLAPGEKYQAEPDPAGMREFLYILQGTMTLELTSGSQTLAAGQSADFPTNQPYAYSNQGTSLLRFIKNVIS
ncbi:XRE family transcriptional regulator [Dongia soli]|uniref:XRE family transcriptional regulator n=1 Tax=Dongia soli TaxID=600628 RepID=A0ABU5E8X7_9PROT|nr:XRE family transcriptional regulator [Dongia soli]MDY0882807.1 XRE family transcriptional regulator [Dongia soli]